MKCLGGFREKSRAERTVRHDHGLFRIEAPGAVQKTFRVIMLEFMNTRIGDFRFGVIHDGRALVVGKVKRFPLEAQRAPREMPE